MERRGFSVVGRNYHSRWGELDLIAVKTDEVFENEMYFDAETQAMNRYISGLQGSGVHFVEVKTRTGTDYDTPGAAVDFRKQRRLRKTALVWLQEQEQYFPVLCFDVVEVWVMGKTAKIRWLQNCF